MSIFASKAIFPTYTAPEHGPLIPTVACKCCPEGVSAPLSDLAGVLGMGLLNQDVLFA